MSATLALLALLTLTPGDRAEVRSMLAEEDGYSRLMLAPPPLLPEGGIDWDEHHRQVRLQRYARVEMSPEAREVRWWGRAAVGAIGADIASTWLNDADETNPMFGGSKPLATGVNALFAWWLHDFARHQAQSCSIYRSEKPCRTWILKSIVGLRVSTAAWNATQ